MKTGYFHTRFKYDSGKNKLWQVLASYFQKYIPEQSRVLDLGAGWCYFINNVAGCERFAIDNTMYPLSFAKEGVNTFVCDVSKACFKDGVFDVVFASNILEHLPKDKLVGTLGECWRLLKPGGTLMVLSPNFRYSFKQYFDDYTHETVLTDRNIQDLLGITGFTVKKIYPKFLPFSANSKLPVSKLELKLYLLSPYKPLAGQMFVVAEKMS